MKKVFKIFAITALVFATLILCAAGAYFSVTYGVKLNESKLIDYGKSIAVYDCDGEKIESASLNGRRNSVAAKDLNEHTINAFIASEDRNFYSHNGLNYKRMIKALYKNLTSFSFKEGASTISQQLVKNTHLSNDKTISRKLKEIKLTRELEKKYEKDEILEMYLNTIYFGHNCYGLQNAANFYFGKDAEELDLSESATLVGLLTSPNNYSPFRNTEKCLTRRNTVLKNMLDCNFIDKETYQEAISRQINADKPRAAQKYGDYLSRVFDELDEINPDSQNNLSGYKIYTYMNRAVQNAAENLSFEHDCSAVVTDRTGVIAYRSDVGDAKRQPGSTVKPLLVYAPAIEEGIIHPFTKIEDEKINYNGYSPENYDKKYHGNVSVAESIKYSYNVPAVKTLNTLTLSVTERYADRMGINLEEDEKNLSLALGGMKYGLELKELCDCYSVFPDGGNYTPSKFIKTIEDGNGKVIYRAKAEKNNVFSIGTCSLMNKMLIDTAESGTAKKLKNYEFDVAAKTGTCGNYLGNTDAYAIGYTSAHTFGVWAGDKDYSRSDITGGGDCCNALKDIINALYADEKPYNLDVDSGTSTVYLDREEYARSGRIILADPVSPPQCRYKVTCHCKNVPSETSTKFSNPTIQKPEIKVNNNKINILLCQTEYYSYLIKRDNIVVYDDKWKNIIEDNPENGTYTYTVTPYYFDGKDKHIGNTVELDRVYLGSGTSPALPDIAYKDWYNR